MALTDVGWAVQLRLPRWDHHLAERLERAGIEVHEAPETSFVGHPLELTMTLAADSDERARAHIHAALRGWTVLLPFDFLSSGPY
jgi:extradiol dioxygenase family protein